MPLLPLVVLCLHCNSFHPERCSLDSNPSLVDADNAKLWNTTPCKPGEPYVVTRRNLAPLRGDSEAIEFTKETSIVVVPTSLSSGIILQRDAVRRQNTSSRFSQRSWPLFVVVRYFGLTDAFHDGTARTAS